MRVMVAGATGSIGREVVKLLGDANHVVRALTRHHPGFVTFADEVVRADALDVKSLDGLGEGVDIFVSALGASVGLSLRGKPSYEEVDTPANLNLLRVAEQAGVRRFVYVGAHGGPSYAETRYMMAHERVTEALNRSKLSATTIRPTGVFTALDDFLDMARVGLAQVIGDGSAKTNPIHPRDVGESIVAHLEDGPPEVSIGGPQILTRREIAQTAFEALGKQPRVISVPPAIPRTMARVLRPFHPRLGDLVAFATAVSTVDACAPQIGTRRLLDYYRALAGEKLLTG